MIRSCSIAFACIFFLSSYWMPSLADSIAMDNRLQQLEMTFVAKVNELEAKVNQLEAKVNQLEAKNMELEGEIAQPEVQLIQNNEIKHDYETIPNRMEGKMQQQESLLAAAMLQTGQRPQSTDFQSADTNLDRSTVSINGMPSSCGDLKMIGHNLNGLYAIMGTTKVEIVYCDFAKPTGDATFQRWIGFSDVKSAPSYFYVTRGSPFTTMDVPITYEYVRVNIGNAMNSTSGIFTAPVVGTYFFSFIGHAYFPSGLTSSRFSLGLHLCLNDYTMGAARIDLPRSDEEPMSQINIQMTLKLNAQDQIYVKMVYTTYGAYIFDWAPFYTHFTGWMLDEEIATVL